MATEKRKIHRVIDAAGTLVQVLPETSAEQVTLADAAGNFTSNNVEGALAEVAQDIKDLETGLASAGKVDDVQDVNGASIVTNKIAKLSKAAVGLGNVDNTADANKSVKHATSADSATTATSATTANSATKATQDASGNVITSTYATKNELRDGLAGRATTKTYENYQAFVTAMGLLSKSELKVGDNVYIKKLDVPDMWVTAVNATSVSYTYTTDQAIINALDTTNGLTVGYFSFSKLETEKVDLSTYQTKTDNSLATTDKTVVGAINEVKSTADSALTKATTNATEIANIKNGTTKVKYAEHANAADKVANKLQIKTAITGTPINAGSFDGSAVRNIIFDGSFKVQSTDNDTTVSVLGAPQVGHALTLSGTGSNNVEYSVKYNGSKNVHLAFYDRDFIFPPNPTTGSGMVTLRPTGVTKGQYSAVNVDANGRVTSGGKSIEWGTSGQTTPSGDLMIGGLFMELQ